MAKKSAKKSGSRKLKQVKVVLDGDLGAPGLVSATRTTTVKYDDIGVRRMLTDYTQVAHGVNIEVGAWEISTDEGGDLRFISAEVITKTDPRQPTGLEGEDEKQEASDDEESSDDDDEGS